MKWNRNSKIVIQYIIGPLLFILLSFSIWQQIRRQPGLEEAWQGIQQSFYSSRILYLAGVILLMMVNWSIEALKWKWSVASIQPVTFWRACKAVLSGVSFSVSMPNRVGEYLGRALYMNEGNRLKTISITIVAGISQLIITLLTGIAGLLCIRADVEKTQLIAPMWMDVILWGTIAVTAVTLLFYFRLSWIVRGVSRLPGSKKFLYLVQALEQFDANMLLRLLLLSLIRYVVFVLQYYLLFRLFEVNISIGQLAGGISVSFLILAIIPSLALLELVQRGEILTRIFSLYSANTLGIGFTAAGIWFINLIIPAIIGSLLLIGIRKKGKNGNRV